MDRLGSLARWLLRVMVNLRFEGWRLATGAELWNCRFEILVLDIGRGWRLCCGIFGRWRWLVAVLLLSCFMRRRAVDSRMQGFN